MRVAFLHFDLCGGPMERNRDKLLLGIRTAAEHGADWVLTPEMALQGYHMAKAGTPYTLASAVNGLLDPFMDAARTHGVVLFLGCGYDSADTSKAEHEPRNSLIVIDRNGRAVARHDKITVPHGSAERWAMAGDTDGNLRPVRIDGVSTGLLVCADSYYDENAAKFMEHGAQLAVVSAAWPPRGCGGPPEKAWQRASRAAGVPVFVCNQTGNSGMDCRDAQSAIVDGSCVAAAYEGDEAVLIYEYEEGTSLAEAFEVYPTL